MASKQDINDFRKRIKRISSPRNTSYYDPDLGMHIPKHVSHDTIRKNAKARKASFSTWLCSLILGGAGLVAAQALRFRYLGLGEMSNATLVVDAVLALFIIWTLSVLMDYRRRAYRWAQAIGAAVALVAVHNLFWLYPDHLALIYTDDYVQIVRATTVPRSLVFRDLTIEI